MAIWMFIGILVLGDQLSKRYIQQHFALGESLPVIPDVFHITYVLNPGAAFGLLEHQTVFFVLIALLLLVAVAYVYPRIPQGQGWLRVGAGLLVGGAVGNVLDRIQTGYVVDFFDFRIWPVFNIADIAIVSGVICIIGNMLYMSYQEEQK